MRTYKIIFTQPERKGVSVSGICQRKDGRNYYLTVDGTIHKDSLPQGEHILWNYRLSSFGEVKIGADTKKRSYSYIYVPEKHDQVGMKSQEDRNHAAKMTALVEYVKAHPEVAYYEGDPATSEQKNPNYNLKVSRGINFVMVDETAIEERDFDLNRKKRKAMTYLDEVYDNCEKTKNFQPLIDLCYGLNTSAKPYMNDKKINYNKLEEFIDNAPQRFIAFYENKSESRITILLRKATIGIDKDTPALINIVGGAYYFNNEVIGHNEGDALFFLRTNQKVVDFLESALKGDLSEKEQDKAENKLEQAVLEASDKELIKRENTIDKAAEIRAYVDKQLAKFQKAAKSEEKTNILIGELQIEVDGYEPQNKTAFINMFNALARKQELPEAVVLN